MKLLVSALLRSASVAALGRCGLCSKSEPSFGLLFDIDGVLVRGKTPIPAAKRAFQKLVDAKGQFVVPVVFVTNAGNCLRQKKADQLSHILGVPSHSFSKCEGIGCWIVYEIGQMTYIGRYERNRILSLLFQSSPVVNLPRVEAVVLFGEPIRWETNLQLIIDVLLTNGNLSNAYETTLSAHLPLLACNMDLMWMAEAHSARFGHGTFMVCLENIYKKITGKDLKYEALMGKPSELTYHFAEFLIREQAAERGWRAPIRSLYAIGDNLMTDIYGANLYNRYLDERLARKSTKAVANMVTGAGTPASVPQEVDMDNGWESELASPSATSCKSILVCTGVYNPHMELPKDANQCIKETVFHGHRDFRFDPALVEPEKIAEDVDAAVQLIFEMEKFGTAV
ncbi:cat eye syndrome critical region protein 5 homolog [Sinocyclocheilus grahami]|uniref:cat eye syndrome critical region protein 5 homolog n=1 Tax=Sinocyclocheilus grahami TaxID=75366 RepID=UPI0007ACB37D|nr:PREDICTED: cat eye syndrome critical region protein 5 homolog [Sinocyclocheilus grahami]